MFFRSAVVLAVFSLPALSSDAPTDIAFFESKVRPLLVERCLDCHSAEHKVKGGLRLDSREGWTTGGDSGAAIVPGNPDESLLIKAIRYADKDLKMPEKRKLPDAEIAILEQWVKMGAPDPRVAGAVAKKQTGLSVEDGRKFWSYIAPKKHAPPAVKNAAWPYGPMDHFVLAQMEAKGVSPAPDAAASALVRRLYQTLLGMPPSPEQIAAFSSVEKVVDELLASPQFGENFARHWLDVARFAESSGGGRTLLFKDAWRYRDFVIESFNRDVPYDRFLREQIAGDLLTVGSPAEKRRLLPATAFLVLGPTNYEEQDKQQLRFDIIDEQLDTIGKGILGQTIGCARCHDHKFDPIPQRDYYALAGIMASTRTLENYTDNVARWIDIPMPLEGEAEEKLRAHEAAVAALKEKVAAAKKLAGKAAAKVAVVSTEVGKPVAVAALPGIVVDDNDAKAIGEWTRSQYSKSYIGDGYSHDADAGKGAKTLTFTPKFPASGRYEVRLAYPGFPNRADRVPVHIFHANGEETVHVNQTQPPPIGGRFISLGRFQFEKDGAGFVLVSNEGTKGFVGADAVQFIPEADVETLAQTTDTAEAATIKELEAELKKLTAGGPRRPVAMTVRDDESPADTHLRIRGLVAQKGALVPRGFLRVAAEVEPAMPEKASGRRELADWLASPQNPLTARVYVNRVWAWLFGSGIVRTTDNFGTTGEAPSHPELLDYLATKFVEEGWSTKKLVREIVLSRTWQLASASPSSADPDNRLFAHYPRRRLDAEQLRDTILATSGELRLDVLGPNINGAGEIDANDTSAQNIEYKYEYTDTRRSVYTPAFRNKRLELFEVFDFGDINATMGKRGTSNVAPQALYLLNNPFVIAQSRVAAERALASSATDEERITRAFLTTFGRPPSEKERAVSSAHIADSARRTEAWSQLYQSLFGCMDFRYLD